MPTNSNFINDPLQGRELIPLKEATKFIGFKDTRVTNRLVLEGKLKRMDIGKCSFITRKSLYEFTGLN